MVWLLSVNYATSHYRFSIDNEDELKLLPRFNVKGKENLKTIASCCPNSKAICTNGTVYTLKGDTNEWVKFSAASGGGGSSGGGADPDWTYTTTDDIDEMFD